MKYLNIIAQFYSKKSLLSTKSLLISPANNNSNQFKLLKMSTSSSFSKISSSDSKRIKIEQDPMSIELKYNSSDCVIKIISNGYANAPKSFIIKCGNER
jgi:hypothetical protein